MITEILSLSNVLLHYFACGLLLFTTAVSNNETVASIHINISQDGVDNAVEMWFDFYFSLYYISTSEFQKLVKNLWSYY